MDRGTRDGCKKNSPRLVNIMELLILPIMRLSSKKGYCNSHYACYIDDQKSTTGFFFFFEKMLFPTQSPQPNRLTCSGELGIQDK